MGLSPSERASRPIQLDAATIQEIASQVGDAIGVQVIEAIRAYRLSSMPGTTTASADTAPEGPLFGIRSGPLGERNHEQRAGLWTARGVAAHYHVARSFVYQHAEELGCIRLGRGPCARLRFDPEVVRDRWATIGGLPGRGPSSRPRRSSRVRAASGRGDHEAELLDFEREP